MFLRALLFLSLVFFAAAFEMDGDVYVLTKDNFNSFVDAEDTSLVEFYAPWCGHCKNLAPEYAKAATTLKKNDPPIKIAKVDATVEPDLASRFGVTGYPTLKVFRRGSPTDYKGPRDASGIISYMQKQAAPSVTVFKSVANVEKFTQDDAAVVYFGDTSNKLYKTFEQTGSKQRDNFRFGTSNADDVLEKYKYKDQIVLLQAKRYSQSPLETSEVPFKGDTESELVSFIQSNILPLVGEIHADNQNLYSLKNLPVVKIYTDIDWKLNNKGLNYLLNRVRKVGKDYSDKLSFAIANRQKFQREMDDFGLKGENPFAIHDLKKNHKFPASSPFSPENLKQLVDDYLAGKLEPYVKSEPVPESQPEDGPVVVVGKNFEQIVMDPTKDVLLEAYAPWCGHCKNLEPKYKELAQKMKKYDSIVIAKVDATANDLPSSFNVRGFPTIFFVPANKKDQPMLYDGAREVNDFEKYIMRNAHLPLQEAKEEL
jgi:protein disulfide isomerase family A protein 3